VTQSPQDELKTDQTKEKVRFRPRSTTALARMRPTSSSILIPVQFDPSANAKIAGAKRRAQSAASLAHFKSSTVYCFDIPAVNNVSLHHGYPLKLVLLLISNDNRNMISRV
jgi:hypothetical protein